MIKRFLKILTVFCMVIGVLLNGTAISAEEAITLTGKWFAANDKDSSSIKLATGEIVAGLGEYNAETDQWVFSEAIPTGEDEATDVAIRKPDGNDSEPSGFKVGEGEGTEENPYTFELVYPEATAYTVTIIGGANATATGGELTQSELTGEMATITFTANEGFHFETYEGESADGITATLNDDGVITVSGTPKKDVSITIPDAVQDIDSEAATGSEDGAKKASFDKTKLANQSLHNTANDTEEEGTPEKPWNVGPEHFPESVQAWLTGEDNRKTLHINGSGAMNSFSVNDRPPFDNYKNEINSVVIYEGVTSTGAYSFYDFDCLTQVTFSGTRTISEGAFKDCDNLSSVTISEGTQIVEKNAFENCSNITSITIPSSALEIGNNAFLDCTSLREVKFNKPSWDHELSVGTNAFTGTADGSKLSFLGDGSATLYNGDTEVEANTLLSDINNRTLLWKAPTVENYKLWVNGLQVTSNNAANVLGDHTVEYNNTTLTLTLNGAEITEAYRPSTNDFSGIYSELGDELTIYVSSDSNVNVPDALAGIWTTGSLKIQGNGKLNVCGKNSSIRSEGNLTIINSIVTATSSENKDSFDSVIQSNGSITISNAAVTAKTAQNTNGIFASGAVTINNGSVDVKGNYYGISGNDITINGNNTIVTADTISTLGSAITGSSDITINEDDGLAITEPEEGKIQVGPTETIVKGKKAVFDKSGKLAQKAVIKASTPVTQYDLWVDDKQVNSGNAGNVLGNGTVEYNDETHTLTLSGATISIGNSKSDYTYGIRYIGKEELNIVLSPNSENVIKKSEGDYSVGIYSREDNANINISGGGTLTVSGSSGGIVSYGNITIGTGTIIATGAGNNSNGIRSSKNVTINGGTVTASASGGEDSEGINASNDVIITDGNLNATGQGTKSNGIYAKNVSISGGTVTASASGNKSVGIFAVGDSDNPETSSTVTISGGTVNTSGTGEGGVGIYSNGITITAGDMTATGDSNNGYGIYANSFATIQGGKINSTGGEMGIGNIQRTHVVTAALNGLGWKTIDESGTAEGIPADSTTAKDLSGYKKVQFPANEYTITVNESQNGTVTTNVAKANEGDNVTLTVTPAEGYELDSLTATDNKGTSIELTKVDDTMYSFTMPAANVTVSATFKEIPTKYNVWVAGIQVTSEKEEDVLEDGGTVSFDPKTNTLTLKGANITTGYKYNDGHSEDKAGIYYAGSENLMIVLADKNNIAGPGITDGIFSNEPEAKVTFTGNGTLTISTEGYNSQGIFASGEIVINGSTVNVTVNGENSDGIYTDNNITINNATVNASASGKNSDGIDADKVTFSNATVTGTASGEDSNGINAYLDDVVIDGGSVIAYGGSSAIEGKVTNSIPGTGWTNVEGTEGKTRIAVSDTGQDLANYRKVQFPGVLSDWAKLQQKINEVDSGATITLEKDVTAEEDDVALVIPEGKNITLNLNGNTLSRGLTEAKKDGNVITVNGNLTVKDSSDGETGTITGGSNNAEDGCGGVNIAQEGSFTLNSGSITGNSSADRGGGVYSSGTFTMNGGTISNNIANEGGGVYIFEGNFTLAGGSISNNTADESGGGVCINDDDAEFTMEAGSDISNNESYNGGGVYVDHGIFNMNGGSITGNSVTYSEYAPDVIPGCYGGGVFVGAGTFNMTGGSITGNTATDTISTIYAYGGGVYIDSYKTGAFTMTAGTISSNKTNGDGGGIYSKNEFTITDGTIKNNEAGHDGGGVYTKDDFSMSNGTITENTSDHEGGGVYVDGGTFKMTNVEISNNTADIDGGGVFVSSDCGFTMDSGSIKDNTSDERGGGVYSCGTFTMKDGTISNNKTDIEGGGVCIDNGTFNLEGGSISGNEAGDYGGGIGIYAGTINMTGGSITGNKVTNPKKIEGAAGGGVYVSGPSPVFNLSSEPIIKNNTVVNDVSNVFLDGGMYITVANALSEQANIGISMRTPGVFTTGSTDEIKASDYIDKFTSDNTEYSVKVEGNELKLAEPEPYPLWVGKTRVTSANKGDVLGDGTVSFNPESFTLTLNGATITTVHEVENETHGIYYSGTTPLKIKLLSENQVGTSSLSGAGICAFNAGITFSGPGGLTATAARIGIAAEDAIIISGGTVIATATGNEEGPHYGIGASAIEISGGTLEAIGKTAGIGTNSGVTIRENSVVTATATGTNETDKAISGTVKNTIAGTGWTDTEQTGVSIGVNTDGQDLAYKKVKFPAHMHNFTYSAVGATITATCNQDDCTLPDKKVTLTIVKPTRETYGNQGSASATLSGLGAFNVATGLNVSEDSIKYYKATKNGETYTKQGEALGAAPTDAGDYVAEITAANVTAFVGYTIAKANMRVTAKSWTGPYDGQGHSITVDDNLPAGTTVTYSEDSETYTETNPSYTDVGSYTVYFQVTNDNYETVKRSKTVWIYNAELTDVNVDDVTLSYTGEEQTPKITASATTKGDQQVTFTYSKTKTGPYRDKLSITNVSESGTFYYKASAPNHEDYTGSFTITMNKAAGSISYATEAITKTYGDDAFTNGLKNTGDGSVRYTSSNPDVAAVDVSTGEITINKVGQATITATVEDGDNYTYDPNTASYTLTVEKAESPATVNGAASVKKGGNTVDLAGNVSLNGATGKITYTISGDAKGCTLSGSTLTSGTNTGSVTVNVTVAADANYNASTTMTITVSVTEKDTQTIEASAVTVTYGDTGKKVSAKVSVPATGGGAITYAVKDGSAEYISIDASTGVLTIKKAGTATVVVTAAETADYAEATKEVTVTINKADLTAPTVSQEGWTYGESAKEPVVSGNTGGGTVTYSYKAKGAADSTYSDKVPTDAGDYTVKATIAETTNYKSGTATADFTIAKAPAPESITEAEKPTAKTGLAYNGTAQELVNAPKSVPEGYTVKYSLDGKTWSSEIPTGTLPGDYTVKVKYEGDSNHESFDGEDLTVSVANGYTVYSGNNQTWVRGSSSNVEITFKASANDSETYSKWDKAIVIDGSAIPASSYTARSGSLVVDLKPAYLDTLALGRHEMKVKFSDGEATAVFNIVEKTPDKKSSDGGSSDKKSTTPTDNVVTCQMAGYPANYAWNESAKACQAGYIDANGNFRPYRNRVIPNTYDGGLMRFVWMNAISLILALACGTILMRNR